jgi:hypothetical protein
MSTSSDHEDDFADLFGVSVIICISVFILAKIDNPVSQASDDEEVKQPQHTFQKYQRQVELVLDGM